MPQNAVYSRTIRRLARGVINGCCRLVHLHLLLYISGHGSIYYLMFIHTDETSKCDFSKWDHPSIPGYI